MVSGMGRPMSQMTSVEFVLHGTVDGVEITPRTIGFSQFNEFNQQAETFLAGSERLKLADAHVQIEDGSYKLRVMLSVVAFAALEPDLRLFAREDALGEIDPKRAEIVARWQARTRAATAPLSIEVKSAAEGLPALRISKSSDYRVGAINPWVAVDKYLLGTVVDMGGAQKANVHLRLDGNGRILHISTSQGYLQEQHENHLYHKLLVHVRAEQHHRTGDLRKLQLIGFVDYSPVYDEAVLDQFAAKGREAWAGVADAAQWVRELRGGG